MEFDRFPRLEDAAHVVTPSVLHGRTVSTIVQSCSRRFEACMVDKTHVNELFRFIVSECKEHVPVTDDAVPQENLLDMLQVPRDKEYEKRVQ